MSEELFVYSGETGGLFLFERKLNENELEYNHFTYKGTLKEVQSGITPSIKKQIERKLNIH